MSYFEDIYLKRLNRYGLNYQSRVQTQRERQFEHLLMKSVYRIDFSYEDEECPGLLERYKQDETETRAYLLTRVSLNIPAGTILYLPNKDLELIPWMVYWLENIKASGYNRYVMLKMTHTITLRQSHMTDIMTEGLADYMSREVVNALAPNYPSIGENKEKAEQYLYDAVIPEKVNADNAERIFINDYQDIDHANDDRQSE